MKLKRLFAADDAVSPVIGVILMVAITVILAVVIGTFVLGLGQNIQKTTPSASISFDQTAGNNDQIQIVHDGGDTLKSGNIDITYQDRSGDDDSVDGSYAGTWAGGDGEITAGETVTVDLTNSYESGDVIQVVWTSENGKDSSVIAEQEPN